MGQPAETPLDKYGNHRHAVDQRAVSRTPVYRTHCLTITSEQDFVVALLVDYSPKGFGAEVFQPLAVNSTVSVTGTVEVGGVWKEYSGPARVAHCEPTDAHRYRIGLAVEEDSWKDAKGPDMRAMSEGQSA